MYKGIIFDLDGTLINTLSDIAYCVNLTTAKYGVDSVDEETIKMRVGNGSRVLIERSLNNASEETVDKALAEYKAHYLKHFMDRSLPYPGIKEMINQLMEMGLKIGVNTNKFDDMAKELVKKYFPGIDTTYVSGQKAGVPDKPSPVAAENIIELMSLNKEEVIFVGDSGTDIKTGKNANIFTIGVTWGYRDINILKENGADLIVMDPNEIVRYIKEN